MGKRGIKPCVSDEEIFDCIKNKDVFQGFHLKSREHSVWQLICNELKNKIKVKNLHQRIAQNRNKIREKLEIAKFGNIIADDDDAENQENNPNFTDFDGEFNFYQLKHY